MKKGTLLGKAREFLMSDGAMISFSRIVDVFTVLISFIDVISDIVVAKQFYDGGHMGWFWAVMASLLLSNVAYTVWCIESYEFNGCIEKVPLMRTIFGHKMSYSTPTMEKFGRFLWVFPFAQFCPTLVWIGHEIQASQGKGQKTGRHLHVLLPTPDENNKKKDDERHDVAAQELKDIEGASELLAAMQGNLNNHLQSHALFYIETIVESIPQSIVQLLAVTMLGEATGMQLFSMSLSLVSIVSKAYLISQSSDLRVFFFKFLLAAHDVFSLFYAFSSVLSDTQPHTTALPGASWFTSTEVLVSEVSAMWGGLFYWKVTTILGLFFTGVGAIILYENLKSLARLKDIVEVGVLGGGGFLVLVVPVIFLGEGLKLGWFILLLFLLEPTDNTKYTMALALRTFCANATNSLEECNRVRHIFVEYAKANLRATAHYEYTNGYRNHSNYTRAVEILALTLARKNDTKLGKGARADVDALVGAVVDSDYQGTLDHLRSTGSKKNHRHRLHRRYRIDDEMDTDAVMSGSSSLKNKLNSKPTQVRTPNFDNDQRGVLSFTPLSVFWAVTVDVKSAFRQFFNESWGPKVAFVCMGLAVGTQVIGALYSLAFPFLNVWHYPGEQNTFQLFCFTWLALCLFACATQLPYVLRFAYFSAALNETFGYTHQVSLEKARTWINLYHRPTNDAVLALAIPPHLVNHDLVGHTALFLSDAALNKRGISLQDCMDLKKNE